MDHAEDRVQEASRLMLAFAERTGVSSRQSNRRYLWTDAFAVCNFVGLTRVTGEQRYLELGFRLIDRVHHTLGRHRPDDGRSGWISGLSELDGEAHPTRGGLRIGKTLPERRPGDAFDEALEWERDGQYFHYLTKWMHALDQVSRYAGNPRFNEWARELAEVACRAFTPRRARFDANGLIWKMSIDLSRPAVQAIGQHDPLDGFVTYAELRATAFKAGNVTNAPPLELELKSLAPMLAGGEWATRDPLGIGGLLFDACRLVQLQASGGTECGDLSHRVLAAALEGLALYAARNDLSRRGAQRLAFRELGLAIGLAALPHIGQKGSPLLAVAQTYAPLRARIEAFWSDRTEHTTRTWAEHRDINEVMLATALLPEGFLTL